MAQGDKGSFAGVGVRCLRGVAEIAGLEARVFLKELIAVVSDWHLGDATPHHVRGDRRGARAADAAAGLFESPDSDEVRMTSARPLRFRRPAG